MLTFPPAGRADEAVVYLRFARRDRVRVFRGRELIVGPLIADAVFSAAARFLLAVLLDNGEGRPTRATCPVGGKGAIAKVLLGRALLLRFQGLLLRLLDHLVGGMTRQSEAGLPVRVHGSVHLVGTARFPLELFLGLGEAHDEFDEPVAVGFRWDGGYLGFVVRHAFP